MDEVFLQGMRFYGRHGVLPEEQTHGQQFVVHVRLRVDLQAAAQSDRVSDTVDYSAVYQVVRERVEGAPVKLLERLGGLIAADILLHWPKVEEVRVQVEKPGAPIAGVLETVGVTITQARRPLDR